MTQHSVGTVIAVVVFLAGSCSTVVRAREQASSTPVFVTLPMTNGFADATHALVESQTLVRQALSRIGEVRLVDHAEDADVVITVLGRGRGDVELGTALKGLDDAVSAPAVPIATNERYIEVMVSVGASYKRAFVGLGLSGREVRPPVNKPAANSWEACAEALARDMRAWLTENAARIRAAR